MAGPAAAGAAAALYVSHLGNAGLHVSWAVRNRRYDPGLITALATLTPSAVVGLHDLARDDSVSRPTLSAGVLTGVALSVTFLPAMKRRARRR